MSYQTITTILAGHLVDSCAAEAHGIAAGMLCIDRRVATDAWLTELFPEDATLEDEETNTLTALFEQTRDLLYPETEQFAFDLLLPSEDEALPVRVEALRNWCQGYLFGVGYAKSTSVWPGECGEIMRDIVEFTKLDPDAEGEEDEAAFTELHEYIRTAVLLIRDQMAEDDEHQTRH